jgi:hypothetical protein
MDGNIIRICGYDGIINAEYLACNALFISSMKAYEYVRCVSVLFSNNWKIEENVRTQGIQFLFRNPYIPIIFDIIITMFVEFFFFCFCRFMCFFR